jgi:hypothetical protein
MTHPQCTIDLSPLQPRRDDTKLIQKIGIAMNPPFCRKYDRGFRAWSHTGELPTVSLLPTNTFVLDLQPFVLIFWPFILTGKVFFCGRNEIQDGRNAILSDGYSILSDSSRILDGGNVFRQNKKCKTNWELRIEQWK